MTLVVRETVIDNGQVWEIVHRTGLRFPTVRNLLLNGWTYQERANRAPYWKAPLASAVKLPGQ